MSFLAKLFTPSGYKEIIAILDDPSLSRDEACKAICAILKNQPVERFTKTAIWLREELKQRWMPKDFARFSLYSHALNFGLEAAAVEGADGKWRVDVNSGSKGKLAAQPVWIEEYTDPQGRLTMVTRAGHQPKPSSHPINRPLTSTVCGNSRVPAFPRCGNNHADST